MPQDLICRSCDYTMSIGWYHYHDISSGYGARTAFACGKCGTTHYVEHAAAENKPDRYLYHRERSSFWQEHKASMPPGEPEESDDHFCGFEAFVCPVCKSKGSVISPDSLKKGPPPCCLCGKQMEELGFWIT